MARVVVLTDEERKGGLWLLKTALGNGIMEAQLGAPVDSSIPEWLVSLVAKFQHPGGITDDMKRRASAPLVGYTCHSEEAAEVLASEVLEAALFTEIKDNNDTN